MNILKYPSDEAFDKAMKADSRFLGAVSLDGSTAYAAAAETAGDHIALLEAVGEENPSGFFRLSFDGYYPPDKFAIDLRAHTVRPYRQLSNSNRRNKNAVIQFAFTQKGRVRAP